MHEGHLDLSSDPDPQPVESRSTPFVGIQFACCGAYARVYRNRDQTAYCGSCPKCGRSIKLRIGQGGVNARFFTAY